VIAALMVLAAIVDLAFCGYRAAAGRNARIDKTRYYLRALGAGAAVGAAVSLALAAVTLAVLAVDPIYPELVAIGARMLIVLGAYSALVLSAIAVYVLAEHELRTLATVAILGPFTLIRPAVVAGAALAGIWPSRSPAAIALTVTACAAVLGAGAWLDRRYARTSILGPPGERKKE
jgi:hypothetical protein